MDSRLFDRITASLATTESRRRLLLLLAAFPLGGWLQARLGADAAEAAHPVGRIQHRADRRRQRARHRRQHRHDLRTRDNGKGGRRDNGKGGRANKGRGPAPGGSPTESGCLPAGTDLPAAVAAAAPGATLQLCAGTWTLTSTLLIDRDLTVRGAGAKQTVLDGHQQMQVIGIRPKITVTLQDLQITNGLALQGGGIFNQGTLSVVDCDVSNNTAETDGQNFYGEGGGIYNEGTLHLVRGGVKTSNASYGGGIYNDGGTVTLEGTDVYDNGATFVNFLSKGGGIYNDGGTVTLRAGTDLHENTSYGWGAGVYNSGASAQVTLEVGAAIYHNQAGDGLGNAAGGGIYNDGGTVSVPQPGMIYDNSAGDTPSVLSNCAGDDVSPPENCPVPVP